MHRPRRPSAIAVSYHRAPQRTSLRLPKFSIQPANDRTSSRVSSGSTHAWTCGRWIGGAGWGEMGRQIGACGWRLEWRIGIIAEGPFRMRVFRSVLE